MPLLDALHRGREDSARRYAANHNSIRSIARRPIAASAARLLDAAWVCPREVRSARDRSLGPGRDAVERAELLDRAHLHVREAVARQAREPAARAELEQG